MLQFFTNTLRGKILFGFIIILTIMIFVTFWSIYNFYRLNESIKQTINENYSSIVAVDNMDKALDDQLNAIIIIFSENALNGKINFEDAKQDFYYWYNKARESAYTEREEMILDSLSNFYVSFINDSLFRMDPEVINNFKPAVKDSYFISIITSLKHIRVESYKLFTINHKFINNVTDEVNNITATATTFMIIIIVAGIVIGFIFSSRFSDYITKPLHNLKESVEHIANGNFEDRVQIAAEDEIGDLAGAFNRMSEKLAVYEKMNLQKILYEKKKSEVVLENINEPVVVIDKQKNILLVNQMFREIFGNLDYEGKKLSAVFINKEIFSELEKLNLQEKKNPKELILKLKDRADHELYFNIIPSAIILPEIGTEGIVLVLNNITRLKELDQLKNEFIGKVSHELKTPLTSLGMAIGLIEESLRGNLSPKQKELTQSMKEDYNRLNKLVYEILQLSKMESGKIIPALEKINVKSFIDEIAKNFRLQLSDKQIHLILSLPGTDLCIIGDPELLQRAVENIISNSIKFTGKNGTIKIDFQADDHFIIMVITDNGIGIPYGDINRIFDKFVQVNDSKPGSVGLGLTIAKEIIEIHKGKIEAASNINEGTSFKIYLPKTVL
ncbi:MAG TPA: ATP-binding protein [Ignavibacteriaceae bacterium]|nr:ATP-binding protein [Ignavibacteriaceae bacterium]